MLVACSSSGLVKNDFPADQRFLDVAENPKKFEGHEVTLRAWITLRHEDRNLWATMKDHESWKPVRCLSLVNYDALANLEPDLDGHFVEVTGTVINDASNNGTVIRLGACRDSAIEISGPSAIRLMTQ